MKNRWHRDPRSLLLIAAFAATLWASDPPGWWKRLWERISTGHWRMLDTERDRTINWG